MNIQKKKVIWGNGFLSGSYYYVSMRIGNGGYVYCFMILGQGKWKYRIL